jgi:hypothetical protein
LFFNFIRKSTGGAKTTRGDIRKGEKEMVPLKGQRRERMREGEVREIHAHM